MIIEKNAHGHIHCVIGDARVSELPPKALSDGRLERGPGYTVRVLLTVNAFSQGSPGVAPC